MKFTDKYIKALKPEAKRYIRWESAGWGQGNLGVRVTPTGTKSWIHLYWIGGRKRMVTLGRYPAMSVAQVHIVFAAAAAAVEVGEDPSDVKAKEQARLKSAPTVTDLFDEYMKHWARRPKGKRSWAQDEAMLRRDVLPKIGTMLAKDVTRRDIAFVLDRLTDRGAMIQVNRVQAVTHTMFRVGVDRGLIEQNPCGGIQRRTKEVAKKRMLSDDEIRVFLAKIADSKMWPSTKLSMLFVLATAQRPGEAVGTRWEEIDLETNWWSMSGDRTKNGDPTKVPLSPVALRILELGRRLDYGTGAAFPSSRGGGVMGRGVLSRALNRTRPQLEMEHFTPHDLRRTATSVMGGLKVRRVVLGKILNHREKTVTGIYDRYDYESEREEALAALSAKLVELGADEALDRIAEQVEWRVTGKWWAKRKVGGTEE